MAAPLPVVEPMRNPLLVQDATEPQAFVARIIPLAGAEDDPHVVVFPRVGNVRQILVRAVEINVLIMVAAEEIADVERAAQTDQVAHGIGMTEGKIRRVIST